MSKSDEYTTCRQNTGSLDFTGFPLVLVSNLSGDLTLKKGRYPTRRIRKVNTLLHTTIPALLKRKRKGGVQRRDSAFCPSSGNLPSGKFSPILLKIFHTRLEYFNILLSIDINGKLRPRGVRYVPSYQGYVHPGW